MNSGRFLPTVPPALEALVVGVKETEGKKVVAAPVERVRGVMEEDQITRGELTIEDRILVLEIEVENSARKVLRLDRS